MGTETWICQGCGFRLHGKITPDRGNWQCMKCAAVAVDPSKPSAGRAPEPAATPASSVSTDTPASQRFSKRELENLSRVAMLMQPVPVNALLILLEAVGGSLVMDAGEAITPRPTEGVTVEWVTNTNGDTRLVLTKYPEDK